MITLWYDDIGKNNCFYKNFDYVYENKNIQEDLHANSISFRIKTTNQKLDKNDCNIYPVELNYTEHNFNIFSSIPFITKELFNNGLKLLLYYPTEGQNLDEWFLNLYTSLKDEDILTSNIFFVSANYDIEEEYKKFLDVRKINDFCTPYYLEYWSKFLFNKNTSYNNTHQVIKEKDFLFYNGKLRAARLLAVSKLFNEKILDKGLISFTSTNYTGKEYNSLQSCINTLKNYNACYDYVLDYVNNFQPLVLDLQPNEYAQENIDTNIIEHYQNTYFSIVSETSVTSRFISEKTFKPIFNRHPFIIIGAPKMLQAIRNFGYHTFPELFDESYDEELDTVKRIHMVINEVKKFCELDTKEKIKRIKHVEDKLKYNQNLFINSAKETKEFDLLFRRINES